MPKDEDIERLNEIVYEIRDLIGQARQIFLGTSEEGRFEGYPYAHIITALSKDHCYLGGSFITFQDCIDGLEGEEEQEG